jgi:hypothetical protein
VTLVSVRRLRLGTLAVAVYAEALCFSTLAMVHALPFSKATVTTKRSGKEEKDADERNTS